MNLYLTADKIGAPTGGGVVTYHELEAFKRLGDCHVWSRDELTAPGIDPWKYDQHASFKLALHATPYKLCHVYAGTFTETVKRLKERGCKVTYTAAAHSIEESRREHELLGIPFDYPHLTDPGLWERYVGGYLLADRLIVPSSHSLRVMRGFGATGDRISVVPHGVHAVVREPAPLPRRYTVGYLGAYGPDKGVIYLLQAWKKLGYSDATLKLAGRDSTSPFVRQLVNQYGGGSIELVGWVKTPEEFYDSLSLYVQPSVTEGFGIEVLEAFSRGRSVAASEGAGASDLCVRAYDPPGCTFPARDVDELVRIIEEDREGDFDRKSVGEACLETARQHTWDKIEEEYLKVWRSL